MIQRYLFELLTLGVAEFQKRPVLIEDIFSQQYGLDATEVAAAKAYFLENPPDVINGYARRDTKFPALAVVLAGEGESKDFLGYGAGQVMDESDPLNHADIKSAVWQYTYHIFSYADHPDVCLWYYEMAKTMIWSSMRWLEAKGLMIMSMSGMELAPDPKYIPEHLFVRQLVFQCQREFQFVDRLSLSQKVFQVAGIHVDKSGSPSDVGGVKTLVTTYTEGDD